MSRDPAGWRPDPRGEHQYRYWDGERWTDRVTDDAVASTTRDPVPADPGAAWPSPPQPGSPASPGSADNATDASLQESGSATSHPLPAASGRQAGRVITKGPSARLLVAAGLGGAAVIVAVVLFVVGRGGGTADDAPEQDALDGEATEETAETPADEVSEELRDTMRTAADALVTAGTFTFDAELEVPPPFDDEQLGQADPVRVQMQGEVHLPDKMHQRVDDAQGFLTPGARERLASGGRTWRRASSFPDAIDEIPWTPEEPGSGGAGRGGVVPDVLANVPDAFAAPLVPQWLAAATGHEDGGTDEGRRVVSARVGDESVPRLGPGPQPLLRDARVDLTVDHTDKPLRVVLSATVGGETFRAGYDLAAIGDPVTIEAPGPDEIDPLPTVNQHDIATVAEDGVVPIGLTVLPDGWQLADANAVVFLEDAVLQCPARVSVAYEDPSSGWMQIVATPAIPDCAFGAVDGRPFTAGDHVGTLLEPSAEEASTTFDAGFGPEKVEDLTVIDFEVAGMTVTVIAFGVPELADVLASLGPVDPAEQAAPPSVDQPAPGR